MLLGTKPHLGLRTHSRLEAPDPTKVDIDPGGGRGKSHEEIQGVALYFHLHLYASAGVCLGSLASFYSFGVP